MTKPTKTPLLDKILLPADLRRMPEKDLAQVAAELRQETIDAVSVTGGHLGAGLGVVELTVALHWVFNTPADRLIWDVGHQAYPHKILTGRRNRIRTLRQGGGLSGFTKRGESEYDPFGAAHSSTSISAGLGMAVARDLDGRKNNVIAVIGDGAMSAGMAYEALNNAGARNEPLIVVLNDNDMSIAPPVGAMSNYLARTTSSGTYLHIREVAKQLAKHLPKTWERAAARAEEYTRTYWTGGAWFEELGFYYVGPIDGHDLNVLLPVLRNVRDARKGPVLVHIVTKKGKGYPPAEASADKYHGVNAFNVITGAQAKSKANAPSYTKVFADSLIAEARKDPKIVAVTAAMPSGTGLDLFGREFPDRTFDVGIAEQHGVTFAAGLATEGYKPFAAIYSTFLQRGYDSIIHDVALQHLPVVFAMDRAGLVGEDGETHMGLYDIAYMLAIPGMTVTAPRDGTEMLALLRAGLEQTHGPFCLRYPRDTSPDVPGAAKDIAATPHGTWDVVRKGRDVAILAVGTMVNTALAAANALAAEGLDVTVVNCRYLKPYDALTLAAIVHEHKLLLTVEEATVVNGFGAYMSAVVAQMDPSVRLVAHGVPDRFIYAASRAKQLASCGLDAVGIANRVRALHESEAIAG